MMSLIEGVTNKVKLPTVNTDLLINTAITVGLNACILWVVAKLFNIKITFIQSVGINLVSLLLVTFIRGMVRF